ncbi:hypothetical protein DDZ13_02430 [Coraliomargarita sinensis]|uniref:Copper resistance protein B n=1 Tax=Coraliomargarita sinensis TaxID=2174842 RepID=A0A317ZJH9_9BACT|nr:hypothetical protein [Coraliomargarita sinensis]PXA05746.1 hypothetical protein DDZ13_02430 [Coraliomargarita sinensis]
MFDKIPRKGLLIPGLINFLLTQGAMGESWTYEVTTTWESKYVENGRNELPEGGIFTAEALAEYKGLSLGAWSVLGDSVDYKELQLSAAYEIAFEGFDLTVGWTHLEFDPASADDDEVFLELVPGHIGGFEFTAGIVYSFEAGGSFLELTLAYPFAFMEEKLTVEPYLQENFDFGYRTAAHDGLSNFQVGLEASYALNEYVSVLGFVSHSWAQADVEREGLGDVSWAGLGLRASF